MRWSRDSPCVSFSRCVSFWSSHTPRTTTTTTTTTTTLLNPRLVCAGESFGVVHANCRNTHSLTHSLVWLVGFEPNTTTVSSIVLATLPKEMSRHPFQWPSDLSVELSQVGHATFLATVWQSLVSFAQELRKQQQQSQTDSDDNDDDYVLEGLPLDPTTGQVARTLTTVTAEQVWDLVQENQDVLVRDDSNHQNNQTNKRGLWTKTMQDWIWTQFVQLLETCPPGTLSLVAWDNDSDKEMSYVLVREAHEKRLTLVLLGNSNQNNHMVSPWYLAQSPFALLEHACRGRDKNNHKGTSPLEPPTVHAGMSHLLFGSLNGQSSSLLDRIGHSLHPWLQAFPKYQLYVTGSPGVGAGLAQLVAVTLACHSMDHSPKDRAATHTTTTTSSKSTNDDDTVSPLPSQLPHLSTPISCIAWGAPRLGNHGWLQHVQVLEQANRLRLLRIHTTDATTTTGPVWGFCHVGFQLNLSSNTTAVVQVSYPKLTDTCGARLHRAWSNRLSFLGHTTHKKSLLEAWHPYAQALQACRSDVAQWDWKELYQTTSYTGFGDPFTKSI